MTTGNINAIRGKAFFAAVVLLTMTLPFSGSVQSWLLIACVLTWLCSGDWTNKLNTWRWQPWFLIPFCLYTLALIGYLYSQETNEAVFKLTKKLALPIVPVMIASVWIPRRLFDRTLIPLLVTAVLSSALFNEARAAYRYLSSHDPSVFLYADFSFFLHPTYYAFIFSAALAWCLFQLFDNETEFKFPTWSVWFAAAFLSLNILQASSRAGILGLGIVWSVVGVALIYHKFRWSWRLHAGFVLLLAGTVCISVLLSRSLRLNAMTKATDVAAASPNDTESSQTRLLIWREALHLIKAKPLFGYGTGDVNVALDERYEKAGMKYARLFELNAHNQYLQEALSNGLVATLLVMLWLGYGVVLAWRKHHWVALTFFLLTAFNLLFESMLERREGIFIIVLLSALFINRALSDDHENTNSPSRSSTRNDTPLS